MTRHSWDLGVSPRRWRRAREDEAVVQYLIVCMESGDGQYYIEYRPIWKATRGAHMTGANGVVSSYKRLSRAL